MSPRSEKEVLDALYPLLRLIARQYSRDAADVEDIVQEGLLRYCKYARREPADMRAYLVACVRNAAIDGNDVRRRRRERERVAAKADVTPAFECPIALREQRKRIEGALERLPLEQREVVAMKIWGELTFPQIGDATGVSANTAASRFRYALAALRKHLDEGAVA